MKSGRLQFALLSLLALGWHSAFAEEDSFLKSNLHSTTFDASSEAAGAVGEESVKKEQTVMSDVSRVSDVAAVGAVGATAVSEMGMKDNSQSASLEKVANIEKMAGYASYATGATDFAMGAYAFASHKNRLEKLKKSGANAAQVDQAIELTKKAAYSHMMYGAGKMAFGYLNMYLAEQNLKQKKNLESLTEENAHQFAQTVSSLNSGAGTGSGVTAPDTSAQATAGNASTGSNSPSPTNSAGASRSSRDGMGVSSLAKGAGADASGGKDGVSPGGGAAAGGAKGSAEDLNASSQKNQAEALGSNFDINLGGGGSVYQGGSGSGKENHPLSTVISDAENNIENANRAPGSDPFAQNNEQAGLAGVNSSEQSLFAIVNAVHERKFAGGMLLGPAQVQVISP